MKTRPQVLIPVVLALLVGITGSLGWLNADRAGRLRSDQPMPERARSPDRGGHSLETGSEGRNWDAGHRTSPASEPARGPRAVAIRGVPASLDIPIGGTVDGFPESVALEGLAHVTMSVVRDPDFGGRPAVLLSIDLSNVFGVGLATGDSYVTSGEMSLIRPLVASDVIEVTFPILPDRPDGALSARPAVAFFTLDFDPRTERFSARTTSTLVGAVNLSR